MDKKKLTVGMKVYLEPCSLVTREKEIKECTISSVGNKYFKVSEKPRDRFFIKTMMHDGGNYSTRYKVFLTLSEINDKNELNSLYDFIRSEFSPYAKKLSLEAARKIKQIIEADNVPT